MLLLLINELEIKELADIPASQRYVAARSTRLPVRGLVQTGILNVNCPCTRHKAYEGVKLQLHSVLTSAEGAEWSA